MRVVLRRKCFGGLMHVAGNMSKLGFHNFNKMKAGAGFASNAKNFGKGMAGLAGGLGMYGAGIAGIGAVGLGIDSAMKTKNALEGNMGEKSFAQIAGTNQYIAENDIMKKFKDAGGYDKFGKGGYKDWRSKFLSGEANQINAQTAARQQQRAAGVKQTRDAYKQGRAGFNKGRSQTGIMGGIKNTWAKSGTLGKAGMVGAGVLATGLAAKGVASMFGGGGNSNNNGGSAAY